MKYWRPQSAGGQEFLGPDGAERFPQLVADQVLPAIAAGEGEIGGFDVAPLGEPGDELRVFIVGVGGNIEYCA